MGRLLGVRALKLIIHHSINTKRSIPARRRVHNVPPDHTPTVVAEDFLSPALVPVIALRPALDVLLEELPATVSCPEISKNKNKEWVCGEPIAMVRLLVRLSFVEGKTNGNDVLVHKRIKKGLGF